MAYDIGPRIGIDGEAEFKAQLRQVNESIKTMGAEMKAVTSEFMDSEDSIESYSKQAAVLNKQISAQEKKLALLENALERANEAYGEGDSRTEKYQRQVYEATAALNKMKSSLSKTEKAMKDLEDEAKDSTSLFGKMKDKIGSIDLKGTLMKGFAAGAVVNAVKEIGGAVVDLVDSTQEYRTIMASLENSSTAAGYSAEQTAETYAKLQGVLGDSQTAATATANLQALGLSQKQLMMLTDQTVGAWARYGDSIPIDGLAEAINETVQVGKVTGTFADVLNWAGVSEDEFNEKLATMTDKTDRANYVMSIMARQGLTEAGQAWQENNKAIVENNRSQDKMEAALARLGGKFAPIVAGLRSFAADGLNAVIDAGENIIDWAAALPGKMRAVGQNLLTGLWQGINDKVSWLKRQVKGVVDRIKSWFTGSDGFDTHSPSKWSEKVFQNVMEGGAIGVRRGQSGMLREVDAAVNAVKRDLSSVDRATVGVSRSNLSASSSANAADLAQAIKGALNGAGVYMDGRRVGRVVTTSQENQARASGSAPVFA